MSLQSNVGIASQVNKVTQVKLQGNVGVNSQVNKG